MRALTTFFGVAFLATGVAFGGGAEASERLRRDIADLEAAGSGAAALGVFGLFGLSFGFRPRAVFGDFEGVVSEAGASSTSL